MPKFLLEASYTADGVRWVAEKGATPRRDEVAQMIAARGGTMECFYFAFGDADVYAVADLPSNEAATALALAINGSGSVAVKTVVLLTPEEVDAAGKSLPS
ncbi:MAG TPA: GYD domain-containing protein [Solirubrobacteraceae bacterium]|jgi:uncharacterized protein with GYD domain